jgi:hypothetical protein
LIFYNNVELLNHIGGDTQFLAELFRRLRSPDSTPADRLELFVFLRELCILAKSMPGNSKPQFFKCASSS